MHSAVLPVGVASDVHVAARKHSTVTGTGFASWGTFVVDLHVAERMCRRGTGT
jgi:hypothetical protein